MPPRFATTNVVKIRVEFPAGHAPPAHARIGLLDNAVHRVINPRRNNVATFHDIPAGPTYATVTIQGLPVARARVVVPAEGVAELTIPARASNLTAGADGPYQGSFVLVDEHSREPLRGRRYRITSASGIAVTGRTDDHGRTQRVGTQQPEELRLELLDDRAVNRVPAAAEEDDEDDDDDDDHVYDDSDAEVDEGEVA